MNNQECRTRTKIININSNEPVFYPFSIKVNKCGGSCNGIKDPYAKLCIPDIMKDVNVFNLMSRTNETRHIKWHKTCKCKCRLDARWNEDKCKCECKELIDKGTFDMRFIWNPSNCECECDKSCAVGEYLGYKNCKCRKRIIDRLVEEFSENIDGNEMLYNESLDAIPLDAYKKVCNSCMVYIVLIVFFFNNKHMHLQCFYLF